MMHKVTIEKFSHAEVDAPKEQFGFLKIPIGHKLIRAEGEDLVVSDGYHTFSELYDHRIELFIAICRVAREAMTVFGAGHHELMPVWRSVLHSDGSSFGDWFILGIGKKAGEQITYHLPASRWVDTEFAETLEKAPEWDGHTSEDVLKRLKTL